MLSLSFTSYLSPNQFTCPLAFNCSNEEIVKCSFQSVFLKSNVVLPLFVLTSVHWYSTPSIQICFHFSLAAFSLKYPSRISFSICTFCLCNSSYFPIISLALEVLASLLTNSSNIICCSNHFSHCLLLISILKLAQASCNSLNDENSLVFHVHSVNTILFHFTQTKVIFFHHIEILCVGLIIEYISFNDTISACCVNSFEIFCNCCSSWAFLDFNQSISSDRDFLFNSRVSLSFLFHSKSFVLESMSLETSESNSCLAGSSAEFRFLFTYFSLAALNLFLILFQLEFSGKTKVLLWASALYMTFQSGQISVYTTLHLRLGLCPSLGLRSNL